MGTSTRRARKTSKTLPSVEKLAKRHGVEPGDFVFRRMAEWREEIEALREAYETAGPGTNRRDAKQLYIREAAEYVKMELEILPYFQGKKRTVEHSGEVNTTVSLLDILKARHGGSADSD